MGEARTLDGDDLRGLARISDIRTTLELASVWAAIAVALAFAWLADAWWASAIAIIVVASRQNALSILAHEGWHGVALRDAGWNQRVCAWLCAYPIALPYHRDQERHLLHHRDVGLPSDPDWLHYSNEGRGSVAGVVRYLLRLIVGARFLANAFDLASPGSPPVEADERGGDAAPIQPIQQEWLRIAVVQGVLFTGLALLFGPLGYLVLWLLPLATVASFLTHLRAYLEHAQPCDDVSPQERLRDFAPGLAERLLLSPFDAHLHALHHAYAQIPHANLQRARGMLGTAEPARGYMAALADQLAGLRRVARDATSAKLPGPAPAARTGPGVPLEQRFPKTCALARCEGCDAADGRPVTGWLRHATDEPLPEPFRDLTFRFVECTRCGLVYMRERPAPEDRPVYEARTGGADDGGILRGLSGVLARGRLRAIRRLMPRAPAGVRADPRAASRVDDRSDLGLDRTPDPQRLLDYGCGSGAWLERMAALGAPWEMIGVDPREAPAPALSRRGIRALRCDATNLLDHVEPGSVGVVRCFHGIERDPDALATLRALYRVLAPGGALIGQTPNVGSLSRRVAGDLWDQWNVPHHLVLFDHDTFARHAKRVGFEVVSIRSSLSGSSEWAMAALHALARWSGRPFRGPRERALPALTLAFLPIALCESLFSGTAQMDFVLRKPRSAPAEPARSRITGSLDAHQQAEKES